MFRSGSVCLLAPLALALACADLTAPSGVTQAAPERPATTAAAARPPAPAGTQAAAPGEGRIKASHVLIAYQGAMRARPDQKRTKDDARKLAESLAQRAKKGEDFGALAVQFSDDPSAKARQGSLGSFDRRSMVKPFADAAFELKPGEVSGVVETDFGFHVIKRDE